MALVTGASGGIGAAVARELVLKGMTVVGLARREELIQVSFSIIRLHGAIANNTI